MSMLIRSASTTNHENMTIYREDGSEQRITREESIYVTDEQKIDETACLFDVTFNVAKTADQNLVSGWASVSVQPDGSIPLDWQGDIIRPEVLEKAAVGFMLDCRSSGVMHKGEAVGQVVESIVLTKEKQAALGIPEGTVPEGWFITVKVIDDEVFSLVKAGTYKMFSIQGRGQRVAI